MTPRWKANNFYFQKIEKQITQGDPILVENNSKLAKNGKMSKMKKSNIVGSTSIFLEMINEIMHSDKAREVERYN